MNNGSKVKEYPTQQKRMSSLGPNLQQIRKDSSMASLMGEIFAPEPNQIPKTGKED